MRFYAFLSAKLKGAKAYKSIAGYLPSSLFALLGGEIASIPHVQIVCNSELDAADIAISKHVRDTALKERWNEAPAEVEALLHRAGDRRLHELLTSGHGEIGLPSWRTGPSTARCGGSRPCRSVRDGSCGSINETR